MVDLSSTSRDLDPEAVLLDSGGGGLENSSDRPVDLGLFFTVESLLSSLVLIVFNVTVIVGNSMVILAVFTHKKLRPMTTNSFIVSLAAADLMVGIAVLPFSSANQVLKYWPFGRVCCRVWLAVDVWLCTASIFNLCAISVDRYLAISRPFRYPQLMSPSRARLLIVVVWILSFVICFPPLIGWNTPEHDWTPPPPLSGDFETSTPVVIPRSLGADDLDLDLHLDLDLDLDLDPSAGNFTLASGRPGGHPVCTLTSEPGYVIYSACGSFWVPMAIMVVFYWKIYKTAVSATAAFRRGFIEKKGGLPNSPSDGALTLRVHRGSRASSRHHSNGCISELLLPQATAVSLRLSRRSFNSCQLPMVAGGGGGGYDSMASKLPDVLQRSGAEKARPHARNIPRIVITSTSSSDVTDNYVTDAVGTEEDDDVTTTTSGVCSGGSRKNSFLVLGNNGDHQNNFSSAQDKRSSLVSLKLSTLNLVSQLRSLNREKKAAKTVGVIVGCFIVCWAPFFTVYLVGAFCAGCTPAMLFHVFFWLGYCNSAVNPFVYGLCSREFRYAFKKLLRCRCERQPRSGSAASEANGRLARVFRGMKLQIVTRHDTQHDNYTM